MKFEILFGITGALTILVIVTGIWTGYATPIPAINTTITNINAALTTATLAEHNTARDCWILIAGKIYQVTNYLATHPGGSAIIIPYCGSDATTAFQTQGGEGSHSIFAQTELASYYIGDLNGVRVINNTNTTINANVATNTNASSIETPIVNSAAVTLDTATVALHNTVIDCWLIINNTVYSLSSYLASHPGGSNQITPYCGKNATTAFATQGGGGSHSSRARTDLSRYAIGTLNSTTTSQTLETTQNQVDAQAPPVSSGEDDEDEEENEEDDD